VPYPTVSEIREPRVGDPFLLCSEGPWRGLADEEIACAFESDTPRAVLGALNGRARDLAQGHGDNCSMVLRRLDEAIAA
jgi:hypothetical protein